ncbi:response regulator transcription factor [Clostridium sp. MB40-C1]|uniref:response regulator transcription factor n=1 Tax=Clostridium sp. MB40-C1 TaxID=3070996 RepID=UPI0027E1E6AE|nr:response regulator transcription factor [Clostridium sp. MB40-C1]WMJ79249.1 response regulator transcription factor [Clostridium sp. MB40-C1]
MINILLVEDDLALSMGIQYALKSEGFNVDSAKSLCEATAKFKSDKYNMILLDVMLPDGSGYELCKSIRENSLSNSTHDYRNIPIIFLTACDEEANVVLGLDLGGDDYITKPLRIKELVSRINAVLRRRNFSLNNISSKSNNSPFNSNEKLLSSGELTLYPLSYKAIKNDKEISLTSVEYKLLLTFINNPHKVLTRSFLLENLWDIDGEFIDDNTLSVYIKRLREKIEEDSKSPSYIITLRGLGYKWDKEVRGEL